MCIPITLSPSVVAEAAAECAARIARFGFAPNSQEAYEVADQVARQFKLPMELVY